MIRRTPRQTALAVIGAVLLAAAGVWGQASSPGETTVNKAAATQAALVRPKTRVTNCLAGGCHAKERNFRYVHGPVLVGACEMCHAYVAPNKHTFTLKQAKHRLCSFCHIGRDSGVVVHEPVQQGQCLSCHHPHGAASRELLRKGDIGTLCLSCHDNVMRDRKNAHGPVRTGSCGACHRSHASMYANLLMTDPRRLCLDCHKQMDMQIARVRHLHKPVKDDCQQCHETHASNYANHLKHPPAELCLSCHDHDNIRDIAAKSTRKHSPVTEDPACMNCHTAHGSARPKLMQAEPVAACLSCHDKPIKAIGSSPAVAAVPELAAPDTNKHGPIRYGKCGACHDVHGGDTPDLLTATHPATFYEPFGAGRYGLCFSCHTEQLVGMKETDAVTDFRNGTRNLHYVHVADPKRGRNCRACHSTHASKNAMHIADTVPFGSWQLPINFTPTKTGGSCASGCHRKLAYDRENPVKLTGLVIPATGPAGTEPAPPATRGAPSPATQPAGT
ncbi:MAG: cytochrome c3 family protein [Planctomycetota bacterium]